MSTSSPAVLRLSLPVQLAIIAASLAVFTTSLAHMNSTTGGPVKTPTREHRVFLLSPKSGSPDELQSLLKDGWRVAHVAHTSVAEPHTVAPVVSVLLENPADKVQDVTFVTVGSAGADERLQHVGDRIRANWRVVSFNASAGTQGGGGTQASVFILER